ncbi:MAG: DUF5686 family protein [Chitinophagaceae bacterium]
MLYLSSKSISMKCCGAGGLFFSVLLIVFSCLPFFSPAQKIIKGTVKDQHSGEPVPFASVYFIKASNGKLADSAGHFSFQFTNWPQDTLVVTNVGFKDYKIFVDAGNIQGDTLNLLIQMEPGKFNTGVVVKAKTNRGLLMWRRIVKNKPLNDRYRFANFSYELYNKLELDFKNVNKEKLGQMKLIKPFSFILENIDTTGVPYLPVYLTESISNYYYQKSPLRRREVFQATKTLGIENESVSKFLGGMDQVINIYSNFIHVFDKLFVSPINDNGDAYYNYKVADTQFVAGKRMIHFLFTPRRKGENTFEGDCWVHDTTYAIQKMNLRLSEDANVNYVDKLSLIQEYQLINDSTWFLAKDKFVVDISPFGKRKFSFIGRKTTTYRNVVVNDTSVKNELGKNKIQEETILPADSKDKTENYWIQSRHEQLSATEQGIYNMIDTLMNLPKFKKYTKAIDFIGTGYLSLGKVQIGPWQNWVYTNSEEGLRLRFDLATNYKFNEKVTFHGYAAYGFADKKWKGEFDVFYLPQRHPRVFLFASYVNDFDYGQNYFDEISSDNIFALAVRKDGVPIKYIRLAEKRLDFFKEWNSGFSIMLSSRHRQYDPVRNLPDKSYFTTPAGEALNAFETSIRLRYAYLERFLENNFYRASLGSPYPIVELKYTKGISGVFNSSYNFQKLSAGISNFQKIPPFGTFYFNLFAGKTYGTLPYMYLDVAPGNEISYYNKYAFNMMNKYEFVHDKYAGVNLEHNFGPGLFRFIPITRKLKFRQLWTAKALWGSLTDRNKQLNFVGDYPFQSLDGRTYLELGTGVDNILKVLRLDFVWRVSPNTVSKYSSRDFGVFGSFRLAF